MGTMDSSLYVKKQRKVRARERERGRERVERVVLQLMVTRWLQLVVARE